MRGVAVDLADTGPQMQAAVRAVGLQSIASESWHKQLPNWQAYPVIKTATRPAGIGTTISDTKQDDNMKLIRRKTGSPEWSLFHPSLAGPGELERGYYLITDAAEAVAWARLLYKGAGREQPELRDVYVSMQAAARIAHTNYVRGLPQIVGGGSHTDVGPTAEQIAAEVIRQQKLPGN